MYVRRAWNACGSYTFRTMRRERSSSKWFGRYGTSVCRIWRTNWWKFLLKRGTNLSKGWLRLQLVANKTFCAFLLDAIAPQALLIWRSHYSAHRSSVVPNPLRGRFLASPNWTESLTGAPQPNHHTRTILEIQSPQRQLHETWKLKSETSVSSVYGNGNGSQRMSMDLPPS